MRNITLSVLLSTLVLVGIGYFTFDADAFRDMLSYMRPWFLVAAVVTTAGRIVLGGWRLSLVSQGRLNLWDGTRGQLAWEFFSSVTPSAVGGGPVTAFYIAQDKQITVGEATAFMIFCMLLDQFWFIVSIPLILLSAFFVDLIPASVGDIGLWTFIAYFAGLLAWSSLFAYATLFRPILLQRVADRLFGLRYLRRYKERVMREMETFVQRARFLRSQPVAFYIKGFLITAATWVGRFALVLFIVWSVYGNVDKVLLVLRTAAMTLCGLVLPTPGGSGGLEGLYALFIGPLMPEALVVPTLFTWRLLGYYVFIALGAYLFAQYVQQFIQRAQQSDSNGVSDQPPSPGSPELPPPNASVPHEAEAAK